MIQKISQAIAEMEEMLNGLKIDTRIDIRKDCGVSCLLPKNHPKLIGRGDSALVFGLKEGIVGKIVSYYTTEEFPDKYYLQGNHVGEVPNLIEKTVAALREMGFDNVLDHVEVMRYPLAKYGDLIILPWAYHFSPDLREGGKYDVYSIDDFPFDKMSNGQELITQIDNSLAKIKSEIRSGKYILEVDHHGTKDEPNEALRRMFIGRVEKQTNQGELLFADLDHCVIYKKSERLYP